MESVYNIWGIMNSPMCPEEKGQKEEMPMKTGKSWSVRERESRKDISPQQPEIDKSKHFDSLEKSKKMRLKKQLWNLITDITLDFHERRYKGVMKKKKDFKKNDQEVRSGMGDRNFSVISRPSNNGIRERKGKQQLRKMVL